MNDIHFPTHISQLPKVVRKATLNVLSTSMDTLMENRKADHFSYYISERPKDILRINLPLVCEDIDVDDDTEDDTEGIIYENTILMKNQTTIYYHYCWIKNRNRPLFDQNIMPK